MQFCTRRPVPPLAPFVEILWSWQSFHQPHRLERLLPDGSMQLVVNLAEDETRTYDPDELTSVRRLPGAVLNGAHSRHFVLDTAEQRAVAGIVFRPGAARAFFRLPAGELQNQMLPLDAVWGQIAHELRERLLATPIPEQRLELMEQILLARQLRDDGPHPAVRFAVGEFLRGPDIRSVADVTNSIGLSSRRFIELFREEVGLTPKLFCRIRRFRRALRRIQAGAPHHWPDLALSCGYFDQAHFIHDFRAFSGISPTRYAVAGPRHLSHVPIRP